MVLEGKKPCIRIRRNRLVQLNSALRYADYQRHNNFRFEKENEIGAWTYTMKNDRWVHVQVVDEGGILEIFAHTEPSANIDPWGHAIGAILEQGVSFSAGSRKLRADLKKVGFSFK